MQVNEVVVYVEGPSDVAVLKTLLGSLVKEKENLGIKIKFTNLGAPQNKNVKGYYGAGKDALVKKLPEKAADMVSNNVFAAAVFMPDLYPPIKVGEEVCKTFDQLEKAMRQIFRESLGTVDNLAALEQRFKVFCFKYDLEVLLLAAEKQLTEYLKVTKLAVKLPKEVEDQNHDEPPKRVIEKLFKEKGKKYNGPTDAGLILRKSNYKELAEKCPQHFKPFVEFLESLEPVTDYSKTGETGNEQIEGTKLEQGQAEKE